MISIKKFTFVYSSHMVISNPGCMWCCLCCGLPELRAVHHKFNAWNTEHIQRPNIYSLYQPRDSGSNKTAKMGTI